MVEINQPADNALFKLHFYFFKVRVYSTRFMRQSLQDITLAILERISYKVINIDSFRTKTEPAELKLWTEIFSELV